jgi:hypothetical protein
MTNGNGMGNSERGRDRRLQAHGGNGAHHLPRVQRHQAEQDGQMLERHVQAGWGSMDVPPLRAFGREVF